MNIDDYKCKIVEKTISVCNGCELEVYQCNDCKGDYFMIDDFVACIPDGRHLCEDCFREWHRGTG